MFQLNLSSQEATRLAQSKDIEVIGATSISTLNHIIHSIVEYYPSIRKSNVALLKNFNDTKSKF